MVRAMIKLAPMLLLVLTACSHQSSVVARGNNSGSGSTPCFDAIAIANSPGTTRVFSDRHVQGGGVTWAAVLRYYAGHHGTHVHESVAPAGTEVTGAIFTIDLPTGSTWFAVDDEADAARFCAGSPAFLDSVRADYTRANSDATELGQVMQHLPKSDMD